MFINQKGSPFYIFRHCVTFSRKKNFEKFKFFPKNLLRFLGLRFSAGFRRSRFVSETLGDKVNPRVVDKTIFLNVAINTFALEKTI